MNLTDGLTEHLQDLTPPPPDLDRVVSRGRRLRRTRLTAQAAAAVLVVGAAGGTALLLRDGDDAVSLPSIASAGPMDLSHGLRAYADPGREVRMGGRSFPADELSADGMLYLDTDAATTPYGLVWFKAGRPFLLGQDGTSRARWQGPVDDPRGWHPTAKVDSSAAVVAFAVRFGSQVTLVVRDLTEASVISLPLDCEGEAGCAGVVVDAIDSGSVFVRTERGTFRWDYTAAKGGDRLLPFAGPRTRVADVRNQTVLYDGPRPTVTLEGWTYVAGAVDAQLTFDGRHILSWSPVLKSTGNGEAITLQVPEDTQFFSFDTDGSVLAATTGDPARFFDCELPSGACEEIGTMQMTGGDPQFIGNDM